MKKIIYFITLACLLFSFTSCEKFLHEEKTTGYTVGYVYGDPAGLQLALNGVYALYKTQFFAATNQHASWAVTYRRSDLIHSCMATGTGNFWAEWNPQYVVPGNAQIKELWNWCYKIISRCNDIIYYAGTFESTPESEQADAEARCIRAYNYLFLYNSFGRIWLNTKAITPENVDEPVDYVPATKDEVLGLLKSDLDTAIDILDWTNKPGRYNKAAAMHLRMQIAMLEEDWTKALEIMDAIETNGTYKLVKVEEVFAGADRNTSENYLVEQWSENLGGTCTSDTGYGHYLSGLFIAQIRGIMTNTNIADKDKKSSDLSTTDEKCGTLNGGYTYGYIMPNSYLLNLYDKDNDKRYNEWFIHKYINHTKFTIKYGAENIKPGEYFPETQLQSNGTRKYTKYVMPGSKKYWDTETRKTTGTVRGFQDIIMMRMAESYIWAAEAALKSNQQSLADKYFNMTWTRAGNAPMSNVTMQDIIDEQARELNFEGGRFFYLKRLGLAADYIIDHSGSEELGASISEATYLSSRERMASHRYFVDLPIPQAQIDIMNLKGGFPQNEGY